MISAIRRSYLNTVASWVVVVLGIPMAVGTSLISNAPLTAGLIATSLGGLIVALFAGIPLQVCGPTVSMAVMVTALIADEGTMGLQQAVILAGVAQLGLGALGVARLTQWIPRAVLDGMLASVGLELLWAEVPVLLGQDARVFAHGASRMHVVLGLGTLAFCAIWRRTPAARHFPVAIASVALGALVADTIGLNVPHVTWSEGTSLDHWPSLSSLFGNFPSRNVLGAAASIAVIGTMQAVLGAASLNPGPHRQLNRQVAALGLGNIGCGLFAGLPITAVVSRTAASMKAGATGRMAGILSGIWAAGLLWRGEGLLQLLPLACLAAVFIDLGLELIPLAALQRARETHTLTAYLVTVGASHYVNLVAGVAAGMLAYHLLRLRAPRFATAPRAMEWERSVHGA